MNCKTWKIKSKLGYVGFCRDSNVGPKELPTVWPYHPCIVVVGTSNRPHRVLVGTSKRPQNGIGNYSGFYSTYRRSLAGLLGKGESRV